MKKKISIIISLIIIIALTAGVSFAVMVPTPSETASSTLGTPTHPANAVVAPAPVATVTTFPDDYDDYDFEDEELDDFEEEYDDDDFYDRDDINSRVYDEIAYELKDKDESIFETTKDYKLKNEHVYGNVFVLAQNVKLENCIIEGDLFAAAEKIEIGEDTEIIGNVFIAGKDLTIDGIIDCELFAAGETVSMGSNSQVGYGAFLAGDEVTLEGNIVRDVNVGCSKLKIESSAIIQGNLKYSSTEKAKIDDEAEIDGEVKFHKMEEKEKNVGKTVVQYFISFAKYFATAMLLLILAMKFAPKFLDKTMEKVTFSSFGWGLLWIIVIPLAVIALWALRLTATLGWVTLFLYIAALILANAVACLGIGKQIEHAHEQIKLPMAVAITAAISWILLQIPFVGGIVGFALECLGFGMLLRSTINLKANKANKENKE